MAWRVTDADTLALRFAAAAGAAAGDWPPRRVLVPTRVIYPGRGRSTRPR